MVLNSDWNIFLKDEFSKEYFGRLENFIDLEYEEKSIFPLYKNIFRAFNLLPLQKLKVVIIGQDPYHGTHQANGLAFSVYDNVKIPPSLRNIYKELQDDMGCPSPQNGELRKWVEQGVLLINSVLTVEEAKANSHRGKGWEIFTDNVISKISDEFENIVFVLWGAPSQKKEVLIDTTKHLVLKASHPSPLSAYRGFLGSKPFSKINAYLEENAKEPIDWCLNGQQTLL